METNKLKLEGYPMRMKENEHARRILNTEMSENRGMADQG